MIKKLTYILPAAVLLVTPLLASPSVPVPGRSDREKIAVLRDQAVKSVRAGDYERAISFFRVWSGLEPENPLVLRDLMWAYWQRERFTEAADTAAAILRLRPNDLDAVDMLSRAPTEGNRALIEKFYLEAVQKGRVRAQKEPLPLYRKMLALFPEKRGLDVMSHLLGGLYRTGQYKEGAEVARYIADRQPDNPDAWNRLAKNQYGLGDSGSALKSYETSLRLKREQPVVLINVARIYAGMRDFEHSLASLRTLDSMGVMPEKVNPLMGEILLWTGRYQDAVPYFRKAAAEYPDAPEYGYYEAYCAYYMGRENEARRKMSGLWENVRYARAFTFLVEDALVHDNMPGAIALLETRLAEPEASDAPLALQLAGLYEKTGQKEKKDNLLARFNRLDPENQAILLKLADSALRKDNLEAAREFTMRALRVNPSVEDVYIYLDDIATAAGRHQAAIADFENVRKLDPTNPHNVFRSARHLYDSGRRQEARDMLTKWLADNKDTTVLPVLLYHGLAVNPHDTMLAYSYHHHVNVFAEHMRALHDNGYTAVSARQVAGWLNRGESLPNKPVMITFDDGRRDSFALGDPILKKYGMKAVMFSALVHAEGGNQPAFLTLDGIREYAGNGRWDIQSHGDLAHIRVPVNPRGERGLYLLNRRWLAEADRIETKDEWLSRIDQDYRSGKDKLEAATGCKVVAFAYPEGNFGQHDDYCNTPDAARENQALVRKYYQLAFVQDSYGINTKTRDPWHLSRLEPDHDWAGSDLIRHLNNKNPYSRAYAQLFDWAVWEDRSGEAAHWLTELKNSGVSQEELLARQRQMKKLKWVPTYAYNVDSQGHRSWGFQQSLDVLHVGQGILGLRQRHAELMQKNVPTAVDNAGGVTAEFPLMTKHHILANLMAHFIEDTDHKVLGGEGMLRSRWTDEFRTSLSAGRDIYNTAAAVNDNVTLSYADATADWVQRSGAWRGSVRMTAGRLSDSNRRFTGWAEASRAIPGTDWLRGIYRFTYDDMEHHRPEKYYSPAAVRLHSLGAEAEFLARRRLRMALRYLPSYAMESGFSDKIEHEVEASLVWSASDMFDLRPYYGYSSSPGYSNNSYYLEGDVRF